MNSLAIALLCLGLVYFGFEYDSGWCFVGAFLAFFSVAG